MLSAPRMSVRSVMPWPLRWLMVAVVLGSCAAVGLWAFEFGKSISGFDSATRGELGALRREIAQLTTEHSRAQSVSNTSESLQKADRAAQEKMLSQIRQLETDNLALRADLRFFETLIPVANGQSIAIRGFQVEKVGAQQLRWQLLVMQAAKNAPEFTGQIEVMLVGTENGKPWSAAAVGASQPLQLRQYRRIEGVIDLPLNAVVKSLSARVMQGTVVRATQSTNL